MKLKVNPLLHTVLVDSEGHKLGKIKDLLFDDREWKIRYLVVDTGTWLHDRLVLITPDQTHLTKEALDNRKIPSTLTKTTIEGCPPLSVDAPVSRRYEAEMASYYGRSPYWMDSSVWGMADAGALVPPSPERQAEHEQAMEEIDRCHVRSAKEMMGYEVVAANDVSLGEVEEMEFTWEAAQIICLIAEEGGLLRTTHERFIPPERVRRIDHETRTVILSEPFRGDEEPPEAETAPGTGLPAATF